MMAKLTAEPFIEPTNIPPVAEEPFLVVGPAKDEAEEPQEETRRLVGSSASEEVFTPTPQELAQFSSLLTVGKREKAIEVLGHRVTIASLNTDDDLHIGMFTKDYLDSTAYPTAVKLATCAAGIRAINNRPIYNTLSSDESAYSVFLAKVEKLREYHLAPLTEIHREILQLDQEFGELAVKLGKLPG